MLRSGGTALLRALRQGAVPGSATLEQPASKLTQVGTDSLRRCMYICHSVFSEATSYKACTETCVPLDAGLTYISDAQAVPAAAAASSQSVHTESGGGSRAASSQGMELAAQGSPGLGQQQLGALGWP